MVTFNNIDINFSPGQSLKKKQWLESLAKLHGRELGELAYFWCSDSYILEANNKYLNHNYITDIITFDLSDESSPLISANILISIDSVRNNAKLYGEKFHVELLRVMSHGLLHLIGFDDHKESDIVMMRKMEDIAINLYEL